MKAACRSRLSLAAVMLLAALSCRAGEETPPEPAAMVAGLPHAGWSSLKYEASGMAGSVSTVLELTESSAEEMQAMRDSALENPPDQTLASHIMLLDISARAASLLKDSVTQGKIWFDPGNGAVLQRDRLHPGRNGTHKIYRFGNRGALRIRREPRNRDEAARPPEDWTRTKRSFYPYDMAGTRCDAVSDPTLLLYLVSAREISTGNEAVYQCLFFDDALYRVWLRPMGSELLAVDYFLQSGTTVQRITGLREVLRVSLRVEPLGKGADSENFELMELRGAIAIYLDTATRLPVQISGERSVFGKLDIGLVEAVLRN